MKSARLGACNWTADQIGATATGFFGSTSPDALRHRLEGALEELGYSQPLFLVNRAVTGLALALRAMHKRKPARRSVIVPAYCSPSVPAAVRGVGLEAIAGPIAPDLNLDLERVGPLLRDDTLAVVGAHMYALPLDISKLKHEASTRGVYVIDDAAHVVGIGRPPLGTAGDVGLLSFNQSKTLSGGSPNGGGALIVRNNDLVTDIAAEYAALPEGAKRQLNYLWFAINEAIEILPRPLPAYLGPLRPFASLLQRWCGATAQTQEKLCAPAACVILSLKTRLPDILEKKKRIADRYLATLSPYENLVPVQLQKRQYSSRFMVRWRHGATAAVVREMLAQRGVASRLAYPRWAPPSDPTSPMIDALRATHLELPGSLRLTEGQAINQIVRLVNECCKPSLRLAAERSSSQRSGEETRVDAQVLDA